MVNSKNQDKKIKEKFDEMEIKLRNSFSLIKQDINNLSNKFEKDVQDMNKKLFLMSNFIKNKEKRDEYNRKKEKKIRDRFERDVDEFTQKTKQVSIMLSELDSIKDNLVTIQKIAKIEENIKQSFREEINSLKDEIKIFRKELKEIKKESKEKSKKSLLDFFRKNGEIRTTIL